MYLALCPPSFLLQGFPDYHVFTVAPRSVELIVERHLIERKIYETSRTDDKGQLVTLPSHR